MIDLDPHTFFYVLGWAILLPTVALILLSIWDAGRQ